MENKKFLAYIVQVHLTLNNEPPIKDVLKMIDRLPKNIECTFIFDCHSHYCLWLLMQESFIKKINEIKGKITCNGIEIEIKTVNDYNELEKFRNEVSNENVD